MSCPKPGHRELCRQLFITRYQQRLQRYTPPPYGVPSNSKDRLDTILPHLLNDKEFYHGRLYASNARLSLGPILWEAIGTIPDEYKVLCDMLVNPSGEFSRIYVEHLDKSGSAMYSRDRVQLMSPNDFFKTLETWDPRHRGLAFHSLANCLLSYRRWLCHHKLAELWALRPCHLNMILPLEYGLMVYIDDEWRRLAWVYLDSTLAATPSPINTRHMDSEVLQRLQEHKVSDDEEGEDNPHAVQVLFSAAGTGKTRHIFQLLQSRWGFYMVAPNLQPGDESVSAIDIVEPQRYGVSRDTLTVFEDHPQMDRQWLSGKVDLSFSIIGARCALLYEFLRKYPEETPAKWLSLQISCETSDPFDALYRLFRLSNSEYLYVDKNIAIHTAIPGYMVPSCYALLRDLPSEYFNGTLYHCFDEAQVALDNAEGWSIIFDLFSSLSVYDILATDWEPSVFETVRQHDETREEGQSGLGWIEEGMPAIYPILLISGTSLRLGELKNLTSCYADTGDTDRPGFHDVFPLVTSDEDFWKLYEDHTTNVLAELENACNMMRDASASHPPLMSRSGRPLALSVNQSTDFHNMRKLLHQPLEILPFQNILNLLGQIYKFLSIPDQVKNRGNKGFIPLSLEGLLDLESSEDVVVFLVFCLVQPLLNEEPPENIAIGQMAVNLFAGYGNLQPDQVLGVIQHELAQPLSQTFSFTQSSVILHETLKKLYMRSLITSYSLGQRGRYRWSTNYIEEIMMLSTSRMSTDYSLASIRSSIEQASINSKTKAMGALKSQMRKLKVDRPVLIQDLFRAAIRAELLSTPTIFQNKGHSHLVTYGFATVQRDGETMRYTLSEPIAVHAIMDYLRTDGEKEYQELMLQWLIHTQDDYEVRSMFGKATEWFVAMSFDRLLRRHSSDGTVLPDLLNRAKRRGVLLKQFGKAIRLDTENDKASILGAVVTIDSYALPEVRTVFEYDTYGTIWKWMSHFRLKGPGSTPTFMFPDINAGPDLIFILERQPPISVTDANQTLPSMRFQNTEKLFVAVQVKTGQSARFENAMETLIEFKWHKNINDISRDNDMQEIDYWKDVPFLLLLICTGITVKQTKIKRWIEKNASRIPQGRFLCVLDETVTSDIWGQDFVTLAETIRKQNMQQQGPWEQEIREREQRDIGGVTWEGQLAHQSRKRPRIDE
ncbi:hypothetical protein NW752_000060 [Fusarium irregulare]|uniref:Uncharacterized protein n=1 Tax=Fusarium irregulare TaxID=2494466 RepID=A0A9W8PZH6_9HYPO|nr:hypothetical protein NW766_001778 [Fusarium irregulare]KAJ4027815.1 hypothetical protein NW752_000060 [Fusarium irregulare]